MFGHDHRSRYRLRSRLSGTDRATIAKRVRETAQSLDITHLLERAPHTLSGGEQQRVALAGVLMQPHLVALDEPFAFLDPAGAIQLRALLQHLHAAGVTLIVAEHGLSEITRDASRCSAASGSAGGGWPPAAIMAGDVGGLGFGTVNVLIETATPCGNPLIGACSGMG